MFCPKCGKRQASDSVRFCTKCGLSLENAATLILTGGTLTAKVAGSAGRQLSPRAKGILQGVALIPGLFGIWLALDIFFEAVFKAGMLGGLYAMMTIILLSGLVRILYAVFLEEGRPDTGSEIPATRPNEIDGQDDAISLAESGEMYVAPSDLTSKDTGEMLQPLSITENTTTKLKTIE